MRVLAVANQKGGVGKTTSAVNIASCLAAAEQRTLLIDLDPQGNATSGLGLAKHDLTRSIYDVLVHRTPLKEITVNTALSFLDIAPSNTQLVGAELELVSVFARETRLANAIQSLGEEYQYIVIDCPPSLNLLTINALTSADGVVVPVQCEYYAMEGLTELVKTIQLVHEHLNSRLQIEGIILTMYDQRNNLARQVASEVRSYFGEKVYETVVPRNVKLSESPSHGKSIILYDVHSKGAKSYLELTRELLIGKKEHNFVQDDLSPQKMGGTSEVSAYSATTM
jgi:chromosome partitioning protein